MIGLPSERACPPVLRRRVCLGVASCAGLLFLLMAESFVGLPLQAEAVPPLRLGEDYMLARSRLEARGWRPRLRRALAECSVWPGDRRCARFPELASCSPTGLGLCRFEWLAPDGRSHAVITREASPDGTPGRIDRWFAFR